MASLIATIAMHPVRIDHEIELLTFFMKGIYELEGVLMVNVIITRSVSDL